jgi:hypothetical protein
MNNLIQDLDNFTAYIQSITRLNAKKKAKIIEAVDLIENTIEEMDYEL